MIFSLDILRNALKYLNKYHYVKFLIELAFE